MSNLYKMSDIDILYKVYKHLLEMLSDRKYTLPISIVNTLDEFKDLYKNDITNLEFVVTHENNKISIFWSNIEKFGIPQLKTYVDHMDNENTNHSILILKNSITTNGKKELEYFNISSPSKYIEYFEYQDLLINITKHILVQKHLILNDSEKKDLLTKYSIKRDTQLPKLYVTDPIAKYYGCRKGNIVKVLRDSVANTSYLTYRIVV